MSTALVTGGSRGIGREICAAFARAGYDVAFTYTKDEAGARETARRIQEAGRSPFAATSPTPPPSAPCSGRYLAFPCS